MKPVYKYALYAAIIVLALWAINDNPLWNKNDQVNSSSMTLAPSGNTSDSSRTMEHKTGFSYKFTKWQRDPFKRNRNKVMERQTEHESDLEMILSAISHSQGNSMAVINGKVVRQGDTVEEWRIASIEEQLVRLTRGNRKADLKLKGK